jgi:hypothetical protein
MLNGSEIQAAIRYNVGRGFTGDQTALIQGVVGATVDGTWGTQTVQRVASWQKSRGLVADGKVGPRTMQAIEAAGNPVGVPVVAYGLLVDGKVVPGTDRIRRDPRAWWAPGERGTRARDSVVDGLVGHWTAGHCRTGEDAGRRVVEAMKARMHPTENRPLVVAIDFVASWDGLIWQTAPMEVATVHAGTIGRHSIGRVKGVECTWPGTVAQARKLGIDPGEPLRVRVGGRVIEVMRPSEALLDAWRYLANVLASLGGLGGISIPRQVPRTTMRMTPAQQRRWKGGQEHCHVPDSTKSDAAGLLVDALDWVRAEP